jgi:hypothetical protein
MTEVGRGAPRAFDKAVRRNTLAFAADAAVRGATGFLSCAKESITPKESESRRKIVRALMLASLQSAISELQAPAWSCLAEPSL